MTFTVLTEAAAGATGAGVAILPALKGAVGIKETEARAATLTGATRAAMVGTWALVRGAALVEAAAATGGTVAETAGTEGVVEVMVVAEAATFFAVTGAVAI